MLNRRTMLLAPLGMLVGGKAAAKTVEIHVKQGISADAFINSRPLRPPEIMFAEVDGETVSIAAHKDMDAEALVRLRHFILAWKINEMQISAKH